MLLGSDEFREIALQSLGALVSNQICTNIDLQTFWDVLLYENIAYILAIGLLDLSIWYLV